MIIKGNIRTDGKALGNYLLSEGRYEKNLEKNERIEIWEATGVEHGDNLKEIIADFQHSAAGTQCKKPLFHVAIRLYDDETLTREQWLEAVNRLEERLELTGRERVIVTHNLNGHEHVHVVWNRIDHEQRKAAGLHYYKHKCTDVARELEKEFGLRELSNDRKKGSLSRDEEQQAIRHGKSPQEIKEELRECWKQADNGKSFAAALDEQGYLLAQGDRRDFVIIGHEGDVYSVARVTGNKAAQVRAKLGDLDRDNMPTVAEAKELQLDRATTRDALKWEDELAKAAIEKQQREEAEAREQKKEQEKQRAGHMGATLYNRADMVHMQRDAMRHLKDAHRKRKRGDPGQQPDEPKQRQADDRARLEKTQREENEAKDVRRDFWEEIRALGRSTKEQAREDKKDRTEQTEYQKAKAQRDALREQTDALLGRQSRGDRGDEVDGHERERE